MKRKFRIVTDGRGYYRVQERIWWVWLNMGKVKYGLWCCTTHTTPEDAKEAMRCSAKDDGTETWTLVPGTETTVENSNAKGEWSCSCGKTNSAAARKCSESAGGCGLRKGVSGDWQCGGCGKVNSGSRGQCAGCGRDKWPRS